MDELTERLARLEPLKENPREEFDRDPYLRDATERNLEISAQCCIDICHRIGLMENVKSPKDYYGSILRMGELGVLPADLAQRLAPLAGFRNILVHEYLEVDWDYVYIHLNNLDDLILFADSVRLWLLKKNSHSKQL